MTELVLIVTGLHVVVGGIFVIIYQISKLSWSGPRQHSQRPSRGRLLKAAYPGLLVLGIGAAMLVVGAGLAS
jgi:hypothetical protein